MNSYLFIIFGLLTHHNLRGYVLSIYSTFNDCNYMAVLGYMLSSIKCFAFLPFCKKHFACVSYKI